MLGTFLLGWWWWWWSSLVFTPSSSQSELVGYALGVGDSGYALEDHCTTVAFFFSLSLFLCVSLSHSSSSLSLFVFLFLVLFRCVLTRALHTHSRHALVAFSISLCLLRLNQVPFCCSSRASKLSAPGRGRDCYTTDFTNFASDVQLVHRWSSLMRFLLQIYTCRWILACCFPVSFPLLLPAEQNLPLPLQHTLGVEVHQHPLDIQTGTLPLWVIHTEVTPYSISLKWLQN
jgi:hypothetical protein